MFNFGCTGSNSQPSNVRELASENSLEACNNFADKAIGDVLAESVAKNTKPITLKTDAKTRESILKEYDSDQLEKENVFKKLYGISHFDFQEKITETEGFINFGKHNCQEVLGKNVFEAKLFSLRAELSKANERPERIRRGARPNRVKNPKVIKRNTALIELLSGEIISDSQTPTLAPAPAPQGIN